MTQYLRPHWRTYIYYLRQYPCTEADDMRSGGDSLRDAGYRRIAHTALSQASPGVSLSPTVRRLCSAASGGPIARWAFLGAFRCFGDCG